MPKEIWNWTRISASDHNSADSQGGIAECQVIANNAIKNVITTMPPLNPLPTNRFKYQKRVEHVLDDVMEYSQNPYNLPPSELKMDDMYDIDMDEQILSDIRFDTSMRVLLGRILAPSFKRQNERVCPSLTSINILKQFDDAVAEEIKKRTSKYNENFISFPRNNPKKYYKPRIKHKINDTTYTEDVSEYSYAMRYNFHRLLENKYIEIVDQNGALIENAEEKLHTGIPMYIKITAQGFRMLKAFNAFKNRKFFD